MPATNEQQVNQINNDETIDLGEMFRVIFSNWKIIIACISLAVFFAVIYLREAKLIYSVDGLVQIEDNQSGSDLLLGALGGVSGGLSNLAGLSGKSPADTEIQLLRSRFVLGRVIHNLNLDIVLTSDQDKWYKRLFHSSSERVRNTKEGVYYSTDGLSFQISNVDIPFSLLGQTFQLKFLGDGKYTVELVDKSKIPGFENQPLITGTVGQQLSQPLGDGTLQLFIKQSEHQRGSVYLRKMSLLGAVKDINDNLMISEKGKQTGVLSLVYGGDQDRIVQTLNEIMRVYLEQNIDNRTEETQHTLDFLERQLPQSKAELEAAEDRYNKFREKNNTVDPTQEVQLLLQQSVDLKTKKIELEQQSVLLNQKYTAQFPLTMQVKAQMDAIDRELQDLESRVTAIPELQRQYLQVYRDVQVDTALYTGLLNSYQQLKVMRAGKVATVRILDQAIPSAIPVKPQKTYILMLSIVCGALFGGILVLLKTKLFSGIKDSAQIEGKTALPVLATVPRSYAQRKLYVRHAKKRGLLANIDPEDLAVESLRSLRTVIHFSAAKAWNNVILITGPSPEIGKSFISANFAAVFAQMGKSVILIDADMRRGTLRTYFTAERTQGLSDYLKDDQIQLSEIALHTSVDGLDFIERGSASINPAELLLTERFRSLIETLSAQYDYVLIDSPPVLAATDAAIMAQISGMTLMVARYAHTHMKELEIAISRLTQAGASVHGVVFNDVQAGDGYGYQYAYQYRSRK